VRLDLDSIDWASLTHAYGSAEDVPGLIGDPRSSDAEVRKAAMDELYSNIYHQGTRYEARAYAVPFLLELMADPTTPARHEIIQLLSCLATGYTPYYVTAGGFPIAEIRNEVAQVPGETWRRWSQATNDWYEVVRTGQRQPLPLTEPERRLLDTWQALAAYDAVRAGVPLLLTCLADPDVEVVGEAIDALAWFPEDMTSIRPRVLDIACDDQRPAQIVGGALLALGLVGGECTQPVADLLDGNLASTDPDLRWAAAVAWAHLAGEGMPDTALAELRGWAAIWRQDRGETIWGATPSYVALDVLTPSRRRWPSRCGWTSLRRYWPSNPRRTGTTTSMSCWGARSRRWNRLPATASRN
jgi:HEAT repeat protein